MFDSETTVQRDLRGGCPPWLSGFKRPVRAPLDHDLSCDILVVGAGITGALMAQHLTALGRQVCVIDRERAGFGSTAASTAMLQWEIDCPLSELTGFYGFERAANVYRRSLQAVAGLRGLVDDLALPCTVIGVRSTSRRETSERDNCWPNTSFAKGRGFQASVWIISRSGANSISIAKP